MNDALTPLTPEESVFAAEQHRLIFSFLDRNGLAERDYYDVVAFGFLKAVQRYHRDPKLQRYAFSTIAWRSMKSSMNLELRSSGTKKRSAQTISLEDPMPNGDKLTVETWLSMEDKALLAFETAQLIQELGKRVSKEQMEIIRMRIAGYSMRLIAKALGMTVREVSATLAGLFNVVMDVCYGTPA